MPAPLDRRSSRSRISTHRGRKRCGGTMHAEASYPVSVAIDDAVQERHPDVRVRGFAVSGLLAAAPRLDIPSPADVAEAAATRFPPGAEIIEDPILRGWREAFRQSGLRPSRYRSRVEALVRRV